MNATLLTTEHAILPVEYETLNLKPYLCKCGNWELLNLTGDTGPAILSHDSLSL